VPEKNRYAEVEEIESVSQGVRGAAQVMGEAAAYAADANPDMYMWGLVGMPFAQAYFMATPQIHLTFHRIPAALEGVAKRIEEAAKAIADNDDEVSRSFDEIEGAGRGKG
jgi:hypothetical protein